MYVGTIFRFCSQHYLLPPDPNPHPIPIPILTPTLSTPMLECHCVRSHHPHWGMYVGTIFRFCSQHYLLPPDPNPHPHPTQSRSQNPHPHPIPILTPTLSTPMLECHCVRCRVALYYQFSSGLPYFVGSHDCAFS